MNDRELLEAAAKAAGYVIDSLTADGGCWAYVADAPMNGDGEPPIFKWNPLADDGDALQLAVKLGLAVDPGGVSPRYTDTFITNKAGTLSCEHHGNDPYAATRRAITSAAAMMAPGFPSAHAQAVRSTRP